MKRLCGALECLKPKGVALLWVVEDESCLDPVWPRHDVGAAPAQGLQFLKHYRFRASVCSSVSLDECFYSSYDGLLHTDLVSPEVDSLGCDVLPLPGVENSVYNADEVTSVAIANVNVTETLNGI